MLAVRAGFTKAIRHGDEAVERAHQSLDGERLSQHGRGSGVECSLHRVAPRKRLYDNDCQLRAVGGEDAKPAEGLGREGADIPDERRGCFVERWVSGSKPRMLSSVSPKKSSRTGIGMPGA